MSNLKEGEKKKIIQGDCLIKLKELEDNSIDSIITDPPYELGFMGKSWDNTGIANNVEMWKECLRVLKPGGHLLSFGGTRTYHRMTSAIEDAGFEVRDMIEWVYGSGFPKSLNIGKAVDKLQGNEREVMGEENKAKPTFHSQNVGEEITKIDNIQITKGTSEWEGWGTALKPAHEPICMARKPLGEKTVALNVLKYGTGGINIDESRVDFIDAKDKDGWKYGAAGKENKSIDSWKNTSKVIIQNDVSGRFPANLIHDNSEEVRECFPETKPTKPHGGDGGKLDTQEMGWGFKRMPCDLSDNGGNASRFFKSIIYQAKASKSERNKGCEELEEKNNIKMMATANNTSGIAGKGFERFQGTPASNNHPTVKPIALMEYLIKMVTPKGGTVLDPFAGSGSTLVAAKQNGYQYIGIELTEEYIPIIEARLSVVNNTLFS